MAKDLTAARALRERAAQHRIAAQLCERLASQEEQAAALRSSSSQIEWIEVSVDRVRNELAQIEHRLQEGATDVRDRRE